MDVVPVVVVVGALAETSASVEICLDASASGSTEVSGLVADAVSEVPGVASSSMAVAMGGAAEVAEVDVGGGGSGGGPAGRTYEAPEDCACS